MSDTEKLADPSTSLFALPDDLFSEVVDSILQMSTGNEKVFTIKALYDVVKNRLWISHPNSYLYLKLLVEDSI